MQVLYVVLTLDPIVWDLNVFIYFIFVLLIKCLIDGHFETVVWTDIYSCTKISIGMCLSKTEAFVSLQIVKKMNRVILH
jgi:hypothetical protein